MRGFSLAFLFFLSHLASGQQPPARSTFESSYLQLQRKMDALKAKGDKINEKSRQEIDYLMLELNHEHSELKRQLEKKNQQIQQKMNDSVESEQNWTKRLQSAYQEITSGFHRAWEKFSKDSD